LCSDSNDYDHNPPTAPEPGRAGRPPEARDKAERFIRDALAAQNDRIGNELAAEFERAGAGSDKTFWRAVKDMVKRGELATDGGKGTGKQTVLHLIRPEGGPGPDDAS
jgi:hypothetical protein